MKNKVLIITSKQDEHADYIIDRCNRLGKGKSVIRLNTEDFAYNVKAVFDGKRYFVEIIDSAISFEDNEIQTVWIRRPQDVLFFDYGDRGVNKFVKGQFETFLNGLYYCTHDSAKWINDTRANQFARNKIYQLATAHKVGFRVPDVLVTNQFEHVESFFVKHLKVCNKSLTVPRYTIEGTVYPYMTRIVEGHDIKDKRESINNCPAFFEEYIEKKVDLRVVIFGDNIFAFEIYSQDEKLAEVDVRGVNPEKLVHKTHKLPDEIIKKIKAFMKEQNLLFSSMDFVMDLEGKYYFIENNCNGQWLWLENITGADMSLKFIEFLFEK